MNHRGLSSIATLFGLCMAGAALAQEKPEVLLGIEFKEQLLELRVYTGGCTSKEDFHFTHDRADPPNVTVHRHQPDYCRGWFPDGTVLQFDRNATEGLPRMPRLKFTNPMSSEAAQGDSGPAPATSAASDADGRDDRRAATSPSISSTGVVEHLGGISYCMDGAQWALVRGISRTRLRTRDPAVAAQLDEAVASGDPVRVTGVWGGVECYSIQVSKVEPAPKQVPAPTPQ